ncbi:hypothetical protein CLV25_102259 [Acetobacteroides hydrogenigenes]|uniref:Uncharacterized protein n=1 Tax=Acetobacteroides hydrogenigenes TaxID=979970 RepID=A0A4R2ETA9_9BACT|nr:hypothetical protein CLV25_102259 [Acetobacteroides hydrogenigenes]
MTNINELMNETNSTLPDISSQAAFLQNFLYNQKP